MCYHHDGDGICESFERTYSVQDCGFYTPEGYTDQWASDVRVGRTLQSDDCPAFVLLGPPAVQHVSGKSLSLLCFDVSLCGNYHSFNHAGSPDAEDCVVLTECRVGFSFSSLVTKNRKIDVRVQPPSG